jgi:HD-GYP domain-containing protein (c-di-GMP phosphodiesterase class II)
MECDGGQLPEVAAAVGDLADLKSPYLHGHSVDVARLSASAAKQAGLDDVTISRIHVAARLHDVRRVGVSDAIWEKPGPLRRAE